MNQKRDPLKIEAVSLYNEEKIEIIVFNINTIIESKKSKKSSIYSISALKYELK